MFVAFFISDTKAEEHTDTTDKVLEESSRSFTWAVLLRNSLADKQFGMI